MSNYTPTLFIDIGATGAYFTLRETHLHYVAGPGDYGNAVVNGVYQGSVEVRSHHVKNLSQDPDEAMEKAREAAEAMGLQLTTTRDALRDELRTIGRADAAEMERRERETAERIDRWNAERAAEEEARRQMILAGTFAFGPHAGTPFRDAPRGYLTWIAETAPEFEEGGLMRLTADEVARACADLLLPKPKPGVYLGEPKQRLTLDVTVTRRFTFARESFNGYSVENVHIVTMVERETGACVVSKSAAFYAEEGENLRIKATVKAHEVFRGQEQTIVQRIVKLD